MKISIGVGTLLTQIWLTDCIEEGMHSLKMVRVEKIKPEGYIYFERNGDYLSPLSGFYVCIHTWRRA